MQKKCVMLAQAQFWVLDELFSKSDFCSEICAWMIE